MAERDKDGFYKKKKNCITCGKEVIGRSCRSNIRAKDDFWFKTLAHEKKKNHPFWPKEENHQAKEIMREIKGAWIDQVIVCNDCLSISEYTKLNEGQLITKIEVQDQGNSYVCDKCQRPLIP